MLSYLALYLRWLRILAEGRKHKKMEQLLNICHDYPFSTLTLDQKANMLIMSTFLLCHLVGCRGSLQRWASYWVLSKWLQRQKLCVQGYQRAALQRWQHQNRWAETTQRWTVFFSVFHSIKWQVNLLKVICLLISFTAMMLMLLKWFFLTQANEIDFKKQSKMT